MIIVITLAAVLTTVSLTLFFALWWSVQRESVGMLMNWTNGKTVTPSLGSPLPLIQTELSGWIV